MSRALRGAHSVQSIRSLAGLVAAALLPLSACTHPPQFINASLGSTPSTVVDVHGNTGLSALPQQCQTSTTPFPALPDQWWQGVTPQVRAASAVVGYETWVADGQPASCPHSRRTDVYRGFYVVDLSPYAGKSGTIVKATAVLTARAVPGMTPAAVSAAQASAPNAFLCDATAGDAFRLVRLVTAFPMPAGFTRNDLAAQFGGNPTIPNAYPPGVPVLDLPTKDPTRAASLGQPSFTADVTQMVVTTLQANVTQLKFMLVGVNEPPALHEAPDVPQTDCKAIFQLQIELQTV